MAIQDPKHLNEKLLELLDLYRNAKYWIILSENITEDTSLACLNEIRNAFDHLMRSIDGEDITKPAVNREFESAKRHLHRTLFDAFEIIVIHCIEKISVNLENFSPQSISTAYPNYYKIINPKLSKIQKNFADARNNKFNVIKGEYKTDIYQKETEELLDITDEILAYVPEISKVENKFQEQVEENNHKKKVNFWLKVIIGVLTSLLVTVIGGLIVFYLTSI